MTAIEVQRLIEAAEARHGERMVEAERQSQVELQRDMEAIERVSNLEDSVLHPAPKAREVELEEKRRNGHSRVRSGGVQAWVDEALPFVPQDGFTMRDVINAVRRHRPGVNGSLNRKSVGTVLRRYLSQHKIVTLRRGRGQSPAVYRRSEVA